MLRTWVLRICGVLLALLSFYSAWNGYVENRTFAAEARVATLEPISEYKETTTTKTKFGIKVSETKTKSAVMTFEVNGQAFSINRNLPDDVFDAFSAGKPVQIEYLPEHPVTTARFVGHPAMPVESMLFGLAVAAITWFFWRKV
ncbi:MAG TPA: hypothetical protein VHH11_05350 [Gammaproteobacteria bacterium]|nr:hypothetical protein [Gammaproteobacteria bacterium]